MGNGEVLIEVCQHTGEMKHGQFYVYRGPGLGGEYLCRADFSWHKNISPGDFWDSPEEAKEAAELARRYARVFRDPAPPP